MQRLPPIIRVFLNRRPAWLPLIGVLSCVAAFATEAQVEEPAPRQFTTGALQRLDELPAGRFRNQLGELSPQARTRALEWLKGLHFPASDVSAMHADPDGGICYACEFGHGHAQPPPGPLIEQAAPEISLAAVPVSPFPDSLKFNSRPGATRRIYINFSGQTVTGTAWNTSLGRDPIIALPFSTDSDTTTFSDSEQLAIKRIWQRMAEDFAPFDVNVTTERPATITSTTAIVLITRNTDASGAPNPASSAGGVAYVNVFGSSNFISTYSPAWVYHNNLGNSESNTAEAASHEIGHNLGLTHDGTSTLAYYGGHGSSSDPISWGPLMGTGYGKNVSQWSKGEYLSANNTQDDLAIIAGKLGYRADDHGNTPGTARPLVITDRTKILSTTPETDPSNLNPANKGIIERNTDVDVFSFVTGSGTVQLNVNPWIQPTGTRGGNLDILLQLFNDTGTLIATSNPANLTTASITATLPQGLYYLHVRNTGTGDPLASTPTGYTIYGSTGQYFISGTIVDGTGIIVPPVAEGQFSALTSSGQASHSFTVTYSDNVAINVATIGTGDVRVTGPGAFNQLAQLVSINSTTNGSPRSAVYSVVPPGGGDWSAVHNGTYSVTMEPNQVQDTEGESVPAGPLGGFDVAIPVPLYSANMSTNPGWTLGANWTYAQPNYASGPNSGFTGNNVIGHSMSGDYSKALAMAYATTPVITNAGASSSLTLRFRRWLGLRRNDTAILQVSGDSGTSWLTLWSTSASISDSSWQLMQYPLPQSVIGSSQIRFRWGLASIPRNGNPPTGIGWHIDDVELLGGGALDASPPAAILSVANLTEGGSPTHSCTVIYSDDTAVLRSSVDITDLLVVGPVGPLAPLTIETVGVDIPGNGTPMSASYSIRAPGSTWDAADNGEYTITLQEGAVEDTLGNPLPETVLGSFTVNISTLTPGVLVVSPLGDLTAIGTVGGTFTPASLDYTLTNSGQTPLTWKAENSQSWTTLSETEGTLGAGASTTVTVSINEAAGTLPAGSHTDPLAFANLTNNNGNTTRNVSLTVRSIYETWSAGPFQNPIVDSQPNADPDSDGLPNLLEFAFGTDPTTPTTGPVTWAEGLLTQPGQPTILAGNAVFQAIFGRRRDHAAAGLTYTLQFSADLSAEWTNSDAEPEIIATSEAIELVKAPFPSSIPTPSGPQPPRFFRLSVTLAPSD